MVVPKNGDSRNASIALRLCHARNVAPLVLEKAIAHQRFKKLNESRFEESSNMFGTSECSFFVAGTGTDFSESRPKSAVEFPPGPNGDYASTYGSSQSSSRNYASSDYNRAAHIERPTNPEPPASEGTASSRQEREHETPMTVASTLPPDATDVGKAPSDADRGNLDMWMDALTNTYGGCEALPYIRPHTPVERSISSEAPACAMRIPQLGSDSEDCPVVKEKVKVKAKQKPVTQATKHYKTWNEAWENYKPS